MPGTPWAGPPGSSNNPQTGGQSPFPDNSITIGNVTPDDFNAKYRNPDGTKQDVFTDYFIRNRYEKDGHRYMMGVTSDSGFNGDTVAFVQLANPTLLLIVEWTACKFNSPPQVPDPDAINEDWVLLDLMPQTASIAVGGDGETGLYRISGTYVYGRRNPDNANVFNNVAFPLPAYLQDTFARTVSPDRLYPGLIDGSTRPSSQELEFQNPIIIP